MILDIKLLAPHLSAPVLCESMSWGADELGRHDK